MPVHSNSIIQRTKVLIGTVSITHSLSHKWSLRFSCGLCLMGLFCQYNTQLCRTIYGCSDLHAETDWVMLDSQKYLHFLLKIIDLGHVVSVLLLSLGYFAFELGGVVLVGLQVLQAQPELLHFSCLFCSQLAHLLQSLRCRHQACCLLSYGMLPFVICAGSGGCALSAIVCCLLHPGNSMHSWIVCHFQPLKSGPCAQRCCRFVQSILIRSCPVAQYADVC